MIQREDIALLLKRGKALRRGARLRLALMIGIGIVLLMPSVIAVGLRGISEMMRADSAVYDQMRRAETPFRLVHWRGSGWSDMPALPPQPPGTLFSAADVVGDIWLYSHDAIYHLENDIWVSLPLPEGERFPIFNPEIGMGAVWLDDHQGGLWHYDGIRWTRHETLVPINSLAVSRHGVFTIDFDQQLARYSDGVWSRMSLLEAIPALQAIPGFAERRDDLFGENAVFHQTDTSDLYLDLNGLNFGIWRFDGDTWDRAYEALSDGEHPFTLRAIDATSEGDVLWLSDYRQLERLDVRRGHVQRVSVPSVTSDLRRLNDFSVFQGELFLKAAFDAGAHLYVLPPADDIDVGTWRELPLPALNAHQGITDSFYDSTGAPVILFVDNTERESVLTQLRASGVRANNIRDLGHQAGLLALQVGENIIVLVLALDVLLVYLPGFFASRRRWRAAQAVFAPLVLEFGAPPINPDPFSIRALLLWGVAQLIWIGIWVFFGGQLYRLLLTVLAVIATRQSLGFRLFAEQDNFLWIVCIVVGYGLARPVFRLLTYAPFQKTQSQILRRIRVKDYEGARAAAIVPTKEQDNPVILQPYLYFLSLYNNGQFAQAERSLWAHWREIYAFDPNYTALIISSIGSAIDCQGERPLEAERLHWMALRAAPESADGYHGLAWHYLAQDPQRLRALELSAATLTLTARLRLRLGKSRHGAKAIYAEYLAVRAWALALNGQMPQADASLREALAMKFAWNSSIASSINFIAGRIALLKPDKQSAQQYFERAMVANSTCWAGQQARAALAGLS